jgi:hypothetical protein
MKNEQIAVLSLIIGLLLANAPFIRLSNRRSYNHSWRDAFFWMLGYVAWMTISFGIASTEARQVAGNWELWAIDIALFAVFGFPGVVWRYLR